MNKTSLYEKHVSLGAKIVDFAGWQMPIQYKNLKEEVLAVRQSVGLFDVSHMGVFFIEGKDAVKYIDFLVPNDIESVQNLKAVYSPLCREDGTIIDDLIVYKLTDTKIMVCVNAANIDKDFTWFEKHKAKFEISLTNESDHYSLLAVQGPKSFETLKKVCPQLNDIDYYSLQLQEESSKPVIFARTGYTGEDGFEIFASHEKINSYWEQLLEASAVPCGLGARDVLRLEVGYPLYGQELDDTVTPLDTGLKWTVKMDKENFIGKEVLLDYKAKYQNIKLVLDKGIPRTGYKVFNQDDKEIGLITSGTMSVMLEKGVAMARIDKSVFNKDDQFFVEIRSKKYEAIRTKKAFYNGGHK